MPVQELDAKFLFQMLDVGTECGLRHVQQGGSPIKAFRLQYADKITELANVHGTHPALICFRR